MDQTTATTEQARPTSTPTAPEQEPEPAPRSSVEPAPAASVNAGKGPANTFEALAVAGFVFGLFAVVAAVFAVGLAARAVSEAQSTATSGGGGGGPAALEVTANEFSFDPNDAEISSTGTITLNNAGTAQHDLVVESFTTDVVEPGESGELTLDGLVPGAYDFYCSIPGHRDAGMEGILEVG